MHYGDLGFNMMAFNLCELWFRLGCLVPFVMLIPAYYYRFHQRVVLSRDRGTHLTGDDWGDHFLIPWLVYSFVLELIVAALMFAIIAVFGGR